MVSSDRRAGPDPAERARTVLGYAATAEIEVGGHRAVLDVVAVDADGSLVLLVAAEGPLADRVTGRAVPGTVRSALVAPVPGPDRLLDTVVAHGVVELADDVRAALDVVLAAFSQQPVETVLRPDASALLRMSVTALRVDGEPVDPAAYAAAGPDPLAAGSDELVAHLLTDHPEQLVALAHLLPTEAMQDVYAVAPLRVDRFGLTFRVDHPGGARRARLDFPAALRGPAELPAAMRDLQSRAAQVTGCRCYGTARDGRFG